MAAAQSKPQPLPGMVVGGDWLQGQLGSQDLVILHVGADADYAQEHLPGAALVKLSDISVTSDTGLRLELPPVEDLAKAFGNLGISASHRVVIYHGTDSVQSATRVWFTFDYLGRGSQAALLDGGLALWKREGRPLSTAAANPAPVEIRVQANTDIVASLDSLRTWSPSGNRLLLDARLPQFYAGKELGIASRAGHIPGAVNRPYPTFFDQEGRWQNADALRVLLRNLDGSDPALVITYCHIGQQATVPYFAARMLGLNAKMFDGSFQAWSREESLIVAQLP